jgi:hypothetical protein
MKSFAVKGLGDAYLRLPNPPTFRWLMRHQGVGDLRRSPSSTPTWSCSDAPTATCAFLRSCVVPGQQQGPWTKQGGYAGVAVGSAPIWFISVNTSQILRDLDDATVVDPD